MTAARKQLLAEEPVPLFQDDNLLTLRHYRTEDGFVSEGRRKGFDPPREQLEELYEVMTKALPEGGNAWEVVMIVRPCPQ